jgi:small-conductance mechanosensitive channel
VGEIQKAELAKFAVAVAATIVALALFHLARTRVGPRITASLGTRIGPLDRRTAGLINQARVEWVVRLLGNLVRAAVWIVALLFIAQRALIPFPATREIGTDVASLIGDPIKTLAFDFVRSIPSLVFVAVVFVAAIGATRLSRAVFDRIRARHLHIAGFYPEWATPTHRIVTVSVVAIATVVAYPYIPGSSSEAFKGVTVFVGVLVSLGSSNIIGNLLSGFVITYMRAFRVGEVIKIGDTTGQVLELNMLVTRLRTVRGHEITIPNTQVLAGHVVNYSKDTPDDEDVTSTLSVTVGYDVSWRRVHELLTSAALAVDNVKRDPAPYVIQRSLLDHAILYELNFVCAPARDLPLLWSRVCGHALDAFNNAGISLMSPRYMVDPATPKIVPAVQPPAASPTGSPGT